MLFNSLEFIFFFIAVIVVYYLIPKNTLRKLFLLASSYYFYACWNVAFLAILFYETLLSYGAAFCLKTEKTKKDKWALFASIFMLLLPLLCFKYLNFILGSFGDLASVFGWALHVPEFKLLLPIGISFYTFMSVGYVIDVHQQKIKPERNVLDYALFIGFFPQIASGPIGRAPQLLPQIKEKHPLLYDNIAAGCKMMLWGFFMKLVVGDRAGIYVDTVFGNWAHHNGTSLLLATFMYTIQIYCDFAGYSLIAIGAAKTMGYELMNNFDRPYFSKNIGEFWRRWHISLSTWFRDYVYFPLGGNRCRKSRAYLNLIITFLVSGLWHGAAYTFIIWGLLHGLVQVADKATKPLRNNLWEKANISEDSVFRRILNICITFVIVSYLWMIFWSPDFATVVGITKGYFRFGKPYIHQTTIFFFALGFAILLFKDFLDEFFPNKHWLIKSNKKVVRYMTFVVLLIIIVLTSVGGGQFIYFKF